MYFGKFCKCYYQCSTCNTFSTSGWSNYTAKLHGCNRKCGSKRFAFRKLDSQSWSNSRKYHQQNIIRFSNRNLYVYSNKCIRMYINGNSKHCDRSTACNSISPVSWNCYTTYLFACNRKRGVNGITFRKLDT